MAIPIKCPGCQAAFEVPESIAGKTIRCTSCKTQLTVPAAAPAPAPANGKQFSFGAAVAAGKSAPAKSAPAKSASAGSALSLDDDGDDRPAKAKPAAARPAARRDNEDDDEPKSRSSKPAKSAAEMLPSTSKGKPARRRDDDDEDDEDDRPARRKGKRNQSAGAGPMLLLIGGGVLGLCAIIGVGVWLAMSSGEGETADNSNNTAETSPANASGENPDGGGGGGGDPQIAPRGPGGMEGEGGGTPAGWQIVQGDGFTVQMPGQPRNQFIPGGGKLLVYEGPDRKGGYLVMSLTLPPQVRRVNPREFLNKTLEEAQQQGNGSRPGSRSFFGGMGSFGRGGGKITLTGSRETEVDGHPASDLDFDTGGAPGMVFSRAIVANGRLIMLFAGHESDPDFASKGPQFIASLKIMNPGGGVAMAPTPGMEPGPGPTEPMLPGGEPMPGMEPPGITEPPPPGEPPMPFPMPGMPPGAFPPMPEFPMQPGGEGFPGGEQGFPGMQAPPPGSLTSPPLAAKVSPFFAIAFDTENKEVYVVTHRLTGRKIEGLVYRYTYPDFKPSGSYNLPNLATKAVIDSKKGMLYLASANLSNPNTARAVGQMNFDRAFASGDIQVFDLAPIRSGKVEIRTELKPVAVVPMSGSIRGLEMAADGKSLFVMVNRTSGRATKSFLRQIDTASRKQTREKAVPEQVATMRLSPDGKSIIAVEYPTAPNKPVSIFIYDTDSFSLRAIPLPGASTDVAVTKDGIFLAAVIGTGAPSAAKLQMLGTEGTLPAEVPTLGWKASNNSYVDFSPDGKRLYVSSLGGAITSTGPMNTGLDVYDIENVEDVRSYRKAASIRESGGVSVGGYFNLSPDGDYIVFRTGAVLATAKLTENRGVLGGNPGEPGVFPPGGVGPMPPGGFVPPGLPAQPGGIPGAEPMPIEPGAQP